MNKIEELENRCRQLEDRVETLEKALVAALARPSERTVVVEKIQPVASWTWFLNGVPQNRGCEYPAVPDGEMFRVHPDKVTWYGGQ